MEQKKNREHQSICRKSGTTDLRDLRALYPGRYDRSQLKERIFQGMHPHLRDSM